MPPTYQEEDVRGMRYHWDWGSIPYVNVLACDGDSAALVKRILVLAGCRSSEHVE